MFYLLPFFEIFSWPQQRFRPPDPDAMTNTALEATASSSGKNSRLGATIDLVNLLHPDHTIKGFQLSVVKPYDLLLQRTNPI